jgi:hypothetical protein
MGQALVMKQTVSWKESGETPRNQQEFVIVRTMMYVLSVDMDNADDDDDDGDAAGRMVLVDLGAKADCVEKAWVVVATAIRSSRNDFMVPDLIRNRRREQRGGNLLVVMGLRLQQRDACLSIVLKTSHAPAVSDPKIRVKDM